MYMNTSFNLPDIKLSISTRDKKEVFSQPPCHVTYRGRMDCGHEQALSFRCRENSHRIVFSNGTDTFLQARLKEERRSGGGKEGRRDDGGW